MKNNKGIITLEASVVLTLFTFFILFFLGFGRVYCAQTVVSHATLQAADAIGTESILRESAESGDETRILNIINHIYGGSTINSNAFKSLESSNISTLAKDKFTVAVANNSSDADKILKGYGVVNGLQGVSFSSSSFNRDTGEVTLMAKYKVKLQFSFLGLSQIDMTKAAKVKNFGEKMYTITAKSSDNSLGSASGIVKVPRNGTAVISASPQWGAAFVKWNDGSTENPRTIKNVISDRTFVATFKKTGFGIEAVAKNDGGCAKITGSGTYQLNKVATLTADSKDKSKYVFIGWDTDNDGKVDNTNSTISFKVTKDRKGDTALVAYYKVIARIEFSYPIRDYSQNENNLLDYQIKVTATTYPANGKLTWSSNNTAVATVSGGTITTGNTSGNAIITATYEVNDGYGTQKVSKSVTITTVRGYECWNVRASDGYWDYKNSKQDNWDSMSKKPDNIDGSMMAYHHINYLTESEVRDYKLDTIGTGTAKYDLVYDTTIPNVPQPGRNSGDKEAYAMISKYSAQKSSKKHFVFIMFAMNHPCRIASIG